MQKGMSKKCRRIASSIEYLDIEKTALLFNQKLPLSLMKHKNLFHMIRKEKMEQNILVEL
jgi:hypothetical protein